MFCPKCGSQNAEETKFCRGCGADIGSVMAVVEGRTKIEASLSQTNLDVSERHIGLLSQAISRLLLGGGFLFISAVIYSVPPHDGIFWLFPLAFAFFFLSAGVARVIQARAIKSLHQPKTARALESGNTDYIKPTRPIYDTEELVVEPRSITERTTNHLTMNDDSETVTLSKHHAD